MPTWTCKYATPTDQPWANGLPCVVIECSCPERCKKIPKDRAGFHSRYLGHWDETGEFREERLDAIAVRSAFCGPKHCTNYDGPRKQNTEDTDENESTLKAASTPAKNSDTSLAELRAKAEVSGSCGCKNK